MIDKKSAESIYSNKKTQKSALQLSKNFSFRIPCLIYYAMFKIKSSRYQDLILNSTGCRENNRLSRRPEVLNKTAAHPIISFVRINHIQNITTPFFQTLTQQVYRKESSLRCVFYITPFNNPQNVKLRSTSQRNIKECLTKTPLNPFASLAYSAVKLKYKGVIL